MHLGAIAERLIINSGKFTDYALNPENPVGADKARMFQSALGFTQNNYEPLLQQIAKQALDAEAIAKQMDEHGQRYQVDLEIVSVEAWQREIARTGWIVAPGSDAARLVTLYVLRRQK
jgi:hypothetical protein